MDKLREFNYQKINELNQVTDVISDKIDVLEISHSCFL